MEITQTKHVNLKIFNKYNIEFTESEFRMYLELLREPTAYLKLESLPQRTLRRDTYNNLIQCFGED